ncbi:MAG: HD domain-containing protein, partial [Candidatus Marsarchaeota archaeon]|nr:HD domain-containing protein [Candidatus Marsarchaeota archaeon]
PFQRLRHINQLALTCFVYPGATHKRLEHSLGVMDLAGRVFDIIRRSVVEDKETYERLSKPLKDEDASRYWRQVVRIAGLLHDLGHLPFSHGAEKELLPEGWNHERLTADIIRHSEIAEVLKSHRPPINPDDVVKLAWDRKKLPESELQPDEWETILNEVITGDTFGVDRIDYLLRDSLHAGVSYGKFDPLRLIDSITVVVDPATDNCSLAIENGGIHGAEALLLARYFMYTQVYFHDVRRAYDKHLQQFLAKWQPDGKLPIDWREYARLTDNEVWAAIYEYCDDRNSSCRAEAERIVKRQHYRTIYTWNPAEEKGRSSMWNALEADIVSKYGDLVMADRYLPKSADPASFPVRTENGDVVNSLALSEVLTQLPPATFGYIFAEQRVAEEARGFLQERRKARFEESTMEGRDKTNG